MFSSKIRAAIALAACVSAQSLTEVLGSADNLSTLTSLLSSTGLIDQLAGTDGITILAPTDDAFDGVDTSNTTLVAELLSYHVLNGVFNTTDFAHMGQQYEGALVPTLLPRGTYNRIDGAPQVVNAVIGGNIDTGTIITFYSGGKAASESTETDIEFDSGVIHKIGSVLTLPMAPSVVAATQSFGELSILAAVWDRTNLVDTIDNAQNVTIFAPVNGALVAAGIYSESSDDRANRVLRYHVIAGENMPVYFKDDLDGSGRLSNQSIPSLEGTYLNFAVDENGFLSVDGVYLYPRNIITANGVMHVTEEVLSPSTQSAQMSGGAASVPAGKTAFAVGAAAVAVAALVI